MDFFSELYSCYYSVVAKILQSAPITKEDMGSLISQHAFSESALYLMPKLCKEEGWHLLEKQNNYYTSVLKNAPVTPLTLLERRWLKSLLFDRRIRLFLNSSEIKSLSEFLADTTPLYDEKYFRKFDMYTDGDNYDDEAYQIHFKQISQSLNQKEIVQITYEPPSKPVSDFYCLPLRIEYSHKNDKFRVFCLTFTPSMEKDTFTIVNIGRIHSIAATGEIYSNPPDITEFLQWKRCSEPITLTVSSKRNGIERFMMEFAGYEKQTEYEEEKEICTASLWYDKTDELEILIKLLSFGPVLQITGPNDFLKLVRERIYRQFQLFHPL